MAADTRPYKSKEQDGQGNELIIRDQQLVEQASQTTMASGEYFEIVDVDGRMAKIPKANMVDIVREALGSLLNGLADQTTVTKVPSLNGNTLGASSVATLASVLGGKPYKTIVNTNDSIPAYGSYMLYAASGKAPGTNTYVGYSFLSNSRAMTFCHPITGEFELYAAYKDSGDIWSAWKQVTLI